MRGASERGARRRLFCMPRAPPAKSTRTSPLLAPMDKSLRRSTLGASSSGGIGLSASSASLDDSFGGGGGLGSSRGAPPSSTFKMSATQSRLSFAGGAPGLGGTQARLSFAGAGVPDR